MFKRLLLPIQKWYQGTSRLETFDKLQRDNVVVVPILITEYHWTAKIFRAIVKFFSQHWKWFFGFAATVSGLYLAYLKLP